MINIFRQRLREYADDGHLKPTNRFCTFNINTFYTILPQQRSIDILVEFLQNFDIPHVQRIDIATIRDLARIVSEANAFV